MKNTIKTYILDNGMINPGDVIWVAFSGGADSCCLLQILSELKTEMDFVLKAVHVNHLLRGDESDRDEEFCKKICAKKGIEIEIHFANVKQIAHDRGMTIEQAGRSARYEIFRDRCTGKVAVAHNMNDNAETVLMNLLRGSGTVGLRGISNKTGKYIRPLLKTLREDIEKYCSDNNIDYINDSTNQDTNFYRNAIRHKVIPLLNDVSGKNVVPVMDRAAGYIDMDNDFIESCTEESYRKLTQINDFRVSIDNEGMKELHPAIASRVARKAIESVKGNLKDIEGRNTTVLMNLIFENRTGNAVNFPDGVNALVQFGRTIVYREIPDIKFEYELPIPGRIFVKEKNLYVTAQLCINAEETKPDGDIHYFDIHACKDGFSIRNRRNGDIIKPGRGVGTVKLKKYFIDRKIERHVRNSLILIACGKSIAYIENMEYGKEFLPGESNENVKVMFERG